jgi:hypothetical protein
VFSKDHVEENEEVKLTKIELKMLRHPEPTCMDCKENLQRLVGRNFQNPNFRRTLLRTIGGERGCCHVMELLAEAHDYARSYFWDRPPDREGYYKIPKINKEGKAECIAYRKQ